MLYNIFKLELLKISGFSVGISICVKDVRGQILLFRELPLYSEEVTKALACTSEVRAKNKAWSNMEPSFEVFLCRKVIEARLYTMWPATSLKKTHEGKLVA